MKAGGFILMLLLIACPLSGRLGDTFDEINRRHGEWSAAQEQRLIYSWPLNKGQTIFLNVIFHEKHHSICEQVQVFDGGYTKEQAVEFFKSEGFVFNDKTTETCGAVVTNPFDGEKKAKVAVEPFTSYFIKKFKALFDAARLGLMAGAFVQLLLLAVID